MLERVARLEREVAALREAAVRGVPPALDAAPTGAAGSLEVEPGAALAVGHAPAAAAGDAEAAEGGAADESERLPDEEAASPPTSAGGAGEPPVPPPSGPAIDWESWLGVRGAAVLGGAVLALAGLFFFRYSIEHGLLPPWVRVVLGLLAGGASLVLSEWALRRDYAGTANGLAGAGVVILYAAFWAAGPLYQLVSGAVTFVGLALVTVVCCALSWRHRSQVIATIGLVGGFLTPLFAASGGDRPIGLFAYVLVLDAALLYTGRRQRWPSLALLSVLGTLAWEAFWIGGRMEPDRLVLGIAVVAVFAAFFAMAAADPPEEAAPKGWRTARAGGVLLPFALALYLTLRSDLGDALLPIGALLVLLSAAAAFAGRARTAPYLTLGAAAADVGVLVAWLATHRITPGAAWTAAGVSAALAAVFHVSVERDRQDRSWEGPAPAALVAGFGLGAALLLGALRSAAAPFWPWLAGWLALAALLSRHATFPGRGPVAPAVAAALAGGLGLLLAVHGSSDAFPRPSLFLAVLVATAAGFQAAAWRPRHGPAADRRAEAERWPQHAGALFAVAALLVLTGGAGALGAERTLLGAAVLLGLLATVASTQLGGGPWSLVAVVATALAHSAWLVDEPAKAPAFLAASLAVVLFTGWPFLVADRLRGDAWSWRAAALAGPAWFVALGACWEALFGDAAIGLLPVLLGALALAAAAQARRRFPPDDPLQRTRLAWLLGVALGFATVAVPLQVEREWITVGWALEGLALVLLWERLDHAGLKYVALALFAAVTLRLVANAEVLAYHPRGSWPILNWLLYTYAVPAAALFAAARRLGRHEVARLRGWERRWYVREQAFAAAGLGFAGLAVVFVWINLAIADVFAPGPVVEVRFERMPARDLTTSIAWGLYALGLLALGVRMRARALRWASLLLLMATIAKVFLHDVGELGDLYRVASLLGLAVSLILVSLAYQRFVLRARDDAEG